MNKFTTQIKLEKTPLILQGIDEFVGKLVQITITEIKSKAKKDDHSLAGTVKSYSDPFLPAVNDDEWEVLK